jgi:hypothetical protein
MKSRNLIGGAIVLAFVVGGFLGNWFPKLGLGPGSGGGDAEPGNSLVQVVSDVKPSERSDTPQEEIPEPASAEDDQVLHVQIAGRDYYIARIRGRSREYHAATMEQIVEAAQRMAGNEQGVRVRISRKQTSKTTAELQLRDALVDAGIAPESIDWQDGQAP